MVAVLVVAPFHDGRAQRVRGTVRDRDANTPVAGAVVSILDSLARPLSRTLSGEHGGYVISRPAAARVIRVIRIGFAPKEIALASSPLQEDSVEVLLERLPPMLDAVRVSARTACSEPGSGAAPLDLLDQIRAALTNASVARREQPAEATNLTYEQDLDPRSHVVIKQTSRLITGVTTSPFSAGLSPDSFAKSGYLRLRNGQRYFYAPDADVLADDSFVSAHCFGITGGDPAHAGLVALTFEPKRTTRADTIVDVKGSMWVDSRNPELVAVDFQYTGVDETSARLGIGGTLHFRTQPGGQVFIDYWSITLATISQVGSSRSFRQAGVNTTGGIVLRARWPDGGSFEGLTGTIVGSVHDKGGSALSTAIAALAGVDSTAADSAGAFRFRTLPPGAYSLMLIDTSFGAYAKPRTVSTELLVARGDTARPSMIFPERGQTVEEICGGQFDRRKFGAEPWIVLGKINDGSLSLPRDLRVEATWSALDIGSANPAPRQLRTSTAPSSSGLFVLCGVGSNAAVRVTAMKGRIAAADTLLTVAAGQPQRFEWRVQAGSFTFDPRRVASLSGTTVLATDGLPLPGISISIDSLGVVDRTDSSGRFRITDLPPGKYRVEVRAIGVAAIEDSIVLAAGRDLERTYRLRRTTSGLDTVRTSATSYHSPMLRQFEARRISGVGRFIAEDQLRKNPERTIGDFLTGRLAGLTLIPYKGSAYAGAIRSQGSVRALRDDIRSPRGCWVSVYVDGTPLYNGDPSRDAPDMTTLRTDDYSGVEFYPGGAAVPAQFNQTRANGCGVLLLWTRDR